MLITLTVRIDVRCAERMHYGSERTRITTKILGHSTMGQIKEKHRTNSHPIIHSPTSEGVSEVSERENK